MSSIKFKLFVKSFLIVIWCYDHWYKIAVVRGNKRKGYALELCASWYVISSVNMTEVAVLYVIFQKNINKLIANEVVKNGRKMEKDQYLLVIFA